MKKRTVLITGATDGIGLLAARKFAERDLRVILHGRNADKLREIRDELNKERVETDYLQADFSSLSQVKRMGEEFYQKYDYLDILVNNAGVGSGLKRDVSRKLTEDGHELRFAVNYLAPYYLTRLLLPALRQSPDARIVNVASAAQTPVELNDPDLENNYSGSRAYGQSKLALIMFTFELADRLAGQNIKVNALHPGSLLNTKMVREAYGKSWGEPDEGAEAIVYLALSPGLKQASGKYFDQKKEARADRQAYDREARGKLWKISAEIVGLEE